MDAFSQNLRRRAGTKIQNSINVTPFVDVVLVLLIIFMVASPMLVTGITVDLPTTKAAAIAANDEPLTVIVDQTGKVYINSSAIDVATLPAKLKAISGENYQLRIFVKGDKQADYGKVIKVLGIIKDTGFTKVALLTNTDD